ncbi:MAG: hypothetical protein R3D00_16750 [Bacteroidia bacterium]
MKNNKFSTSDLILRLELILSESRDLPARDVNTIKDCIEVLKNTEDDNQSYGWILKVAIEILPELMKVFMNMDL